MSETVVRKQRAKKAGKQTPSEFAEECDRVQEQLKEDFYRREAARRKRLEANGEK